MVVKGRSVVPRARRFDFCNFAECGQTRLHPSRICCQGCPTDRVISAVRMLCGVVNTGPYDRHESALSMAGTNEDDIGNKIWLFYFIHTEVQGTRN